MRYAVRHTVKNRSNLRPAYWNEPYGWRFRVEEASLLSKESAKRVIEDHVRRRAGSYGYIYKMIPESLVTVMIVMES